MAVPDQYLYGVIQMDTIVDIVLVASMEPVVLCLIRVRLGWGLSGKANLFLFEIGIDTVE